MFLMVGNWPRSVRFRTERGPSPSRATVHAGAVADLSTIFWLFFLAQFFIPLYQKQALQLRRERAIRGLQDQRHTRVITMIHRQETMNFLGFPIARFIDIEDSEKILRAIRLTASDMPIDLVLHTPGGLVLAAEQIAFALRRHRATVTVFVPHYAMSGGTLIALAADQIIMDPNAVLGPVDPQLGMGQGSVAAASIIKALSQPNPNRDDQTIILGDLAEKALRQVKATVKRLLLDHHGEADAERIASKLASGEWTHDYPLMVEELRSLGFTLGEDMPRLVYDLMELYPQTDQQRPGVEFLPLPYAPRPVPPTKSDRR
jgi:ClpP class serine protease